VSEQVDRRQAEAWFRRRGLPVVVRRRVRGVALLPRATPAIVFFLLVEPLIQTLAFIVNEVRELWPEDGEDSTTIFTILVLALTVAALVIPPLGGWLVSRLMRRFDQGGRVVIALVVLAVGVGVLVVEQVTGLHERPFWVSAAVTVGGIVILLALTYIGAGSILAWAARVAVNQVGAVGTLASKALPLLMIVILLSFFTNEIWQLVDPDVMKRPRLWAVVGFFAALGVLFLWSVVSDEMKALAKQRRSDGVQLLRERLSGTPFAELVADDHDTEQHELSRGERANLVLVFFFAQAVQVVIFAFLVFCFFVVFGALAINETLIQDWVNHKQLEDGKLFGLELPVSNQLIQVSVFLSAFSGLYFAGAAATDPLYRDKFFDPLVRDIRVSLAAREAYLGRWGTEHVHEH
jgi:hypothetical protein